MSTTIRIEVLEQGISRGLGQLQVESVDEIDRKYEALTEPQVIGNREIIDWALDRIAVLYRRKKRIFGALALFGVPDQIRPLAWSEGRVRFRFRNKEFARVYFRTAERTRAFHLGINDDGTWSPIIEIGRNNRETA